MNFDNLNNDYFSKIYSGDVNEFNKFIHNNNLSINITNKNKENALHVVIKSDLSDILKINFIKYLISKNININDKDCFGNTPFNLACQKQLYNIMIVLYNKFKNKINLYDKNNYNLSPMSYILKGQIVDEFDDYPSPDKFIKKDPEPKINDVSKLLDAVKEYINSIKFPSNPFESLIKIIAKNIKFELQINKSLVDIKIDEFKKKIIENKNDLSSDFKYQFYNEIFNIIKKSHPKTFDHIDFDSTKSLDDDGFYLKKNGSNSVYKIHGLKTFEQNLKIVENNNLLEVEKQESKFNEMKKNINPKKFFFPFLEEIAHIYYCNQFSKNIKKLYNSPNKCKLEAGKFKSNLKNQLNDFIEYINSLGDGNKVIKITSGQNHNLVLTSKGQVYSFGDNTDGKCGFDPTQNQIDIPTLIEGTGVTQGDVYNYDDPKLGKIKDISCGLKHSLILNEDGTVFSFGDNTNGQCGYIGINGPNNNGNKWRPYKIPDNIPNKFENKNFISLACGNVHNLLLHENSTVFTFGNNGNFKLGRNPPNINNNSPDPIQLTNTGIIKIACGANHSMMINQDGRVFGFGDNNYGQTGVNRNINLIGKPLNLDYLIPVGFEDNNLQNLNRRILPIKGTGENKTNNEKNIYGKIIDIACGNNHTMILNDKGEVYSFGLNNNGQLGYNFDLSSFQPAPGGVQINFINIPGGINKQVGLYTNKINEELYNYILKKKPNQGAHVFYNNNNNNISQPLPITDTLKDYNNNNYKKIKSIACGVNHSMIITEEGEVFSFGQFDNGRLGLGNLGNPGANVFSPQRIINTGYSKYGKIISASAGDQHSLILNKNGNVFSFGNSNNGRLGNQPPVGQVQTPQIINDYVPLLEPMIVSPEELDTKYIIRDNTLFKNFSIKINNLQNACLSAIYIYIKNIVTNDEIFIYNKDKDPLNIYEIIKTNEKKSNSPKIERNLSLEIIYNNKLELKLNNKTLGIGQFEIKFYNYNFDEIQDINIKTNEFNEVIDSFFKTKLKITSGGFNNIFKELENDSDKEVREIIKKLPHKFKNYNINLQNIKFNDSDTIESINKETSQNDIKSTESELSISEGGASTSSTTSSITINDFFEEKKELNEFIKFYNEIKEKELKNLIKIDDLEFDINETYFDKSKLNLNYLEKFGNKKNEYKNSIINTIDQFDSIQKAYLNKNLSMKFGTNMNQDFNISSKYNDYINNINKLKKLDNTINIDIDSDLKYINIDDDDKKNLFSPAYQDFYYYFRYYILERIIIDNLNYNPDVTDDIKNELKKIFEYYDFNTDTDEIKAAKLAVIGDILDHLLINKIHNVIFNEINAFVKDDTEFKINNINTFDSKLIDINNEFDVDLSKMNDKIKNVLVRNKNIKNELEYNLGNVLINNVKIKPVLYYTNNFFDINFNKQQFILYNEKLKNELKDRIKLDYDLIKSLIENQNILLINDLKDKIILDNNKIIKLIDYIQKNKIDNNIYNYSDFCENYNYHLEEELKQIQNHKNIFKYYDHLICIFIYFYKSKKIYLEDTYDYLTYDLKDSLRNKYTITESSDNTEIKKYSKTNIIKNIKQKFNENPKKIEINKKNIKNLEKMLIESKDVEKNNNLQLKKEFISICSAIDLIVGNIYSKLLKRFLFEYLTNKYSSEVDSDEVLKKLKEITSNIMTNVDKLINSNFDFKNIDFTNFDLANVTEFTKKLVILYSEGRYEIKEYVELDEDNLFNEIVYLIKSNSYEKIEEDDIVLTYLKDNINDYFKNYYKLAIKTLIACSSGLNNYILYHNKFNKIKKTLEDKFKENENMFDKYKRDKEKKIKNNKEIVEIFSKKDMSKITGINNNYKKKIENIMKIFKKP